MNFYKKNKYVNKVHNARLNYFTAKLCAKKVNTFFIISLLRKKNISLTICDPLLWVDLLAALIIGLMGNLKSLMVIAFEMYHIDTKALRSERLIYRKMYKNSFFSILKFEIMGLIKVLNLSIKLKVLNLISIISNLIIVVHSEHRKRYLEGRSIGKKSTLKFYRHFPMSTNRNMDLRSENFLLLAGRINNLVDFEKVIKFSVANQVDIYVIGSGAEELHNSSLILPPNVKLLGSMPNEEVLGYAERCLAGIVLYENTSVNQSFSASTKLFEFLYYGKPIICSMNPGLIEELKSGNACFCSVDDLIGITSSYFLQGSLNKINNNFTFEGEIIRYLSVS
ncbi:hypothetical protein [Polynucleobacter sp. AP-Feld-500C-C5]|uniref:hypothetical protein n=1 Tax=Polynucleobacter sp. AP-Feld-500C-C5 TaxID=2576924 RepID=UPI001C0E315C|nr:hypothetical protein [Polynucleobacter sp. AP-Feld-500C-C5]MBU3632883.1 glycosyltransferase [Polynucleobacter sp. AP-Feld-500C-C5]